MKKYNEVKRKAAVGERIKIVRAVSASGAYKNGDMMTVTRRRDVVPHGVFTQETLVFVYDEEYVVLEPVTSAPTPLTSDPLYDNFRQFIRDNADGLRKILAELDGIKPEPVAKTLKRAEVIEQARKDVEELTRVGGNRFATLPERTPFSSKFYVVDFAVNRNKRTVTALISKGHTKKRTPDEVVIAKCAPGDVFHAEIGKAIALRKALGLTVPAEYTDAPQPDEPRVGAVVDTRPGGGTWTAVLKRRESGLDGIYGRAWKHGHDRGWIGEEQFEVIDDTDVDYNAVSTKEAA
ncbi:hypothetical protein [Paenibacillus sp. SN-8-1]|uniref:hypothetical protein n=1 Tax=Paenibacillus sp. SN-8-1 TaxID=3435409 RepID=UPI003D9AA43D